MKTNKWFVVHYNMFIIFVCMIILTNLSNAAPQQSSLTATPDLKHDQVLKKDYFPLSDEKIITKESPVSHSHLYTDTIEDKVDKNVFTDLPSNTTILDENPTQYSNLHLDLKELSEPMEAKEKSIHKRSPCKKCGGGAVIPVVFVPVAIRKGGGCRSGCGKRKKIKPCGGSCGGGCGGGGCSSGGGGSFAYASASAFSYGR